MQQPQQVHNCISFPSLIPIQTTEGPMTKLQIQKTHSKKQLSAMIQQLPNLQPTKDDLRNLGNLEDEPTGIAAYGTLTKQVRKVFKDYEMGATLRVLKVT